MARITAHGKRVRFHSTIELVNAVEAEKAGRIAHPLQYVDLRVLDELGYLPFSQARGALLRHVLSKLCERTSTVIINNTVFAEWASAVVDPKRPPPSSTA